VTPRARVLVLVLLIGVVAVSSALAGSHSNGVKLTSSLDGKAVLPLRSHWIAYPQTHAQIAEVDFFIDGYHAWTSTSSPWTYGDEGNWLVTSFIKPGMHTFTVRATLSASETAVDKFQARVVAPPRPPAKLAGAWTRAGRTLLIGTTGWAIGPNQRFDARYVTNGEVSIGPEIVNRPEQVPTCGTDPPQNWTVVLSAGGKGMQLSPIGKDPCSARLTALQGTWKRSR